MVKTLITTFILFLAANAFAQSTDYHSSEKLGKKAIIGQWYISGVKKTP